MRVTNCDGFKVTIINPETLGFIHFLGQTTKELHFLYADAVTTCWSITSTFFLSGPVRLYGRCMTCARTTLDSVSLIYSAQKN